jgi:hypothetical protein
MELLPKSAALDPTLFAVNWDVVFEVLVMIVVLAFVMERALAQLFESKLYIQLEARREGSNAKSLIAFLAGAGGCYLWQFDVLSIILQREEMTVLGAILTGAVIAGGSKASLKLFQDVMDVKSSAHRRSGEATSREKPPQAVEALRTQRDELLRERDSLLERERAALQRVNTVLEEQTRRVRDSHPGAEDQRSPQGA